MCISHSDPHLYNCNNTYAPNSLPVPNSAWTLNYPYAVLSGKFAFLCQNCLCYIFVKEKKESSCSHWSTLLHMNTAISCQLPSHHKSHYTGYLMELSIKLCQSPLAGESNPIMPFSPVFQPSLDGAPQQTSVCGYFGDGHGMVGTWDKLTRSLELLIAHIWPIYLVDCTDRRNRPPFHTHVFRVMALIYPYPLFAGWYECG